MKQFSSAGPSDLCYSPKWGLYGSVARIYLGVSSSSKRWVTDPGQFCRSIGCVSFSIPSKRLAILSFLKNMWKMWKQASWRSEGRVSTRRWQNKLCVLFYRPKTFFLYLFISKKSRLFGSKSFLNSETETTKDYVAYKTTSFRNLLKYFRIRRNSQIKFRGLK